MSLSRVTRTMSTQCRHSPLLFGHRSCNHLHSLPEHSISPLRPLDKVISRQVSFLHQSALHSSAFQWFGFSSSASPQPSEGEAAESGIGQGMKADNEAGASAVDTPVQEEASISDEKAESDLEIDLSKDDLVKLVAEKEQLLATKQEELENMKDKVLRTYADAENVKDRMRRESENAKKFAVQNFAKSLLDVADNLARASSAAKESFSKIDTSKDTAGAIPQLKILLEGVEMTEKQLSEVFKKFGLEKYDPINEEFDPNRHNAVFQVPDASKPADRVGVVLKAGYMLHDRVIRPAEVGVTVAVNSEEAEN